MSNKDYSQLAEVKGFAFPVYASAGVEQQAYTIASRCQRAYRFLRDTFSFPAEVNALILSASDWSSYATFPVYGMPHYSDERTLVVAGENNGFWRNFAPPPEILPPSVASAFQSAYGQADGSIDLVSFFNLLAVHELAHLFHSQAPVHFPRLWLMELFCNVGLHAYVVNIEPEQLPVLETFPQAIVNLGYAHLPYHALADFERLYANMDAQNFGWYQCQLHVASKHIYDNGGVEVLQRFWKAFLLPHNSLSDEQLADWLHQEVHPEVKRVLVEWVV